MQKLILWIRKVNRLNSKAKHIATFCPCLTCFLNITGIVQLVMQPSKNLVHECLRCIDEERENAKDANKNVCDRIGK